MHKILFLDIPKKNEHDVVKIPKLHFTVLRWEIDRRAVVNVTQQCRGCPPLCGNGSEIDSAKGHLQTISQE